MRHQVDPLLQQKGHPRYPVPGCLLPQPSQQKINPSQRVKLREGCADIAAAGQQNE